MFLKFFFLLSFIAGSATTVFATLPVRVPYNEAQELLEELSPHPVICRAADVHREIQATTTKFLKWGSQFNTNIITPQLLADIRSSIDHDREALSQYHLHLQTITPAQFSGIFPLQNVFRTLSQLQENEAGLSPQIPLLEKVRNLFETPDHTKSIFARMKEESLTNPDIILFKYAIAYLSYAIHPNFFVEENFQKNGMGFGIPMLPQALETPETLKIRQRLTTSSPLFYQDTFTVFTTGFQEGWPSPSTYLTILEDFKSDDPLCLAFDAASFISLVIDTEHRLSIEDFSLLWKAQKGQDIGAQKDYVSYLASTTQLQNTDLPSPGDIILWYDEALKISSFSVYLKKGETVDTYYGIAAYKGPSVTGLWESVGVGIFPLNKNPMILRPLLPPSSQDSMEEV